jgi:2-dehydro-3-deoxyphosphogluconate aldolase/(4S)-4-hydroxy-2-oxoglutarate aldolase
MEDKMAPSTAGTLQQKLGQHRLVPVVSLPSVESALKLSELLTRYDLPVVEITFRTSSALEGIAAIKKEFPDVEILAGTVLSQSQVVQAADAGAAAIVSPGFTPKMAAFCSSRKIPFFPGVYTPSEIQMAMDAGLDTLKFFPAETAGGTGMLALFQSLYQDIRFMPTGGINRDNLLDYLSCSNVLCCGGTWLSPHSLMAEGRWEEIEQRVADAVSLTGKIA